MNAENNRESRLRKRLARRGYALRKSRKDFGGDNLGEYMIIGHRRQSVRLQPG